MNSKKIIKICKIVIVIQTILILTVIGGYLYLK